jgi:hypothetical protein
VLSSADADEVGGPSSFVADVSSPLSAVAFVAVMVAVAVAVSVSLALSVAAVSVALAEPLDVVSVPAAPPLSSSSSGLKQAATPSETATTHHPWPIRIPEVYVSRPATVQDADP